MYLYSIYLALLMMGTYLWFIFYLYSMYLDIGHIRSYSSVLDCNDIGYIWSYCILYIVFSFKALKQTQFECIFIYIYSFFWVYFHSGIETNAFWVFIYMYIYHIFVFSVYLSIFMRPYSYIYLFILLSVYLCILTFILWYFICFLSFIFHSLYLFIFL